MSPKTILAFERSIEIPPKEIVLSQKTPLDFGRNYNSPIFYKDYIFVITTMFGGVMSYDIRSLYESSDDHRGPGSSEREIYR